MNRRVPYAPGMVSRIVHRRSFAFCRLPGFAMGILAWLVVATAAADDTRLEARGVAASCGSCHGTNGAASRVSPPLAGQSRAELTAKLKAFKADARAGTVMPQLARGYSDAQLEQAAAWFSTRQSGR